MGEVMLTTLKQKVDPHHAALIVVDVQNDFAASGGVMDREGFDLRMAQEMVARLVSFIEEAREAKVPIIYIQSVYDSDPNWYLSEVWLERVYRKMKGLYTQRDLCVKGSWGWEFYGGIKPLPNEVVVTKHRYSAFIDTDLDLILRSKNIKTLIMTGVVTNVCVETTARMGFMKDYYIVLLKDCCAAYLQHLHDTTIENIDNLFGQVVNAQEVVRCWKEGY
jgi:ureidoacrylate peracid hydrolase